MSHSLALAWTLATGGLLPGAPAARRIATVAVQEPELLAELRLPFYPNSSVLLDDRTLLQALATVQTHSGSVAKAHFLLEVEAGQPGAGQDEVALAALRAVVIRHHLSEVDELTFRAVPARAVAARAETNAHEEHVTVRLLQAA